MSFLRQSRSRTRAEQLRQKRQQPVNSARQTAERKPAPRPTIQNHRTENRSVAHVSPVVSRSIRYGTPLPQTTITQPRRKVIYSVGANGVETRMPSLPIIHFNWQWVSGVLTIGCILLVLLLTNLSIFQINLVNVEGLNRVTAADLQPIISSNTRSVFTLDKVKALNALAIAFPELKDIQIQISLPDTITISATERQPIMAWKNGDQVYWLDADGIAMQPRGESGELLTIESTGTLPLAKPAQKITSLIDYAEMVLERQNATQDPNESRNYFDQKVMNAAIQMSQIMPLGSTLVYDSLSGLGWREPGGWKVYFGTDLTNIQFKQVEYQAIMQQLTSQGITPVVVNLKHVDSPYYRTE